MKITLYDKLRLKRYPELARVIACVDREGAFEWLVKEKENIPVDLYAKYLRACYQINTYQVPLQLMERAFQGIPRKLLMDREEMKRFRQLPEKIIIYRGTDMFECSPRFSWSLNIDIAKKFSRGRVFRATISKNDIIAYFCGDTYEEEIVVNVNENYEIID